MSEQDSAAEKSFDATPQRLQKVREKGEVVKSADLSVAATYVGFALALFASDLWLTPLFEALAGFLFYRPEGDAIWILALRAFGALATVIAFPAAAVIGVLVAQRAILFSSNRIIPKLDRISPLAQAKSKFGPQGLIEFLKSTSKLCFYLMAWVMLIPQFRDGLLASANLPPLIGFGWGIDAFVQVLLWVAVLTSAVAAFDYLWQRFSFLRKHKMTRKDLMDEHKESEGDPHLKQQRRARALEMSQHQMAVEVPKANVVIVNPTHYAVALAWSPTGTRAPICVAKGVDAAAAQIRALAQEHRVPIQSNPPIARALYAEVDLGQEISPKHYKAVAAAIRFAEAMRKKRSAL